MRPAGLDGAGPFVAGQQLYTKQIMSVPSGSSDGILVTHGDPPGSNQQAIPQSPIGPNGEDIVSSSHSDYLPGQNAMDPVQVDRYAEALRAGAPVKPVEYVTIAQGDNEVRIIAEGHHRYVAGKRTGIPVDIIEGLQDPGFFVDDEESPPLDWSGTYYEPWQSVEATETPDDLQLLP